MEKKTVNRLEGSPYAMVGEDGVPAELLKVRSALRSLPHVACPVGFEFRLQKRLEGNLEQPKNIGFSRGWMLGWSGAALGVATAMVIAVVAFDFNSKSPVISSISSSQVAGNQANHNMNPGGLNPQTVSQPVKPPVDIENQTNQLLANEKGPDKATAKRDSIHKGTGLPPQDYIQTVSGNGR